VLFERETVGAPVTPATQFLMDDIERQREHVIHRKVAPGKALGEIERKVNAELERVRRLLKRSAS